MYILSVILLLIIAAMMFIFGWTCYREDPVDDMGFVFNLIGFVITVCSLYLFWGPYGA